MQKFVCSEISLREGEESKIWYIEKGRFEEMSSFEIHGLNLEATELRLGIPGRDHEVKKNTNQAPRNSNKRPLPASKKEEEVSKAAASSPK